MRGGFSHADGESIRPTYRANQSNNDQAGNQTAISTLIGSTQQGRKLDKNYDVSTDPLYF